MKRNDNFYDKKDIPKNYQKRRIWNNVARELIKDYSDKRKYIEWRSFALGLAAAVILFFTSIGIYTVVNSISEKQKPHIVHLTEAYKTTVSKLENMIPENIKSGQTVNIDDEILPKKERLTYVNEAINDLQNEYNKNDYSRLKLERLYSLYKMKLEILEEIIAMEEI